LAAIDEHLGVSAEAVRGLALFKERAVIPDLVRLLQLADPPIYAFEAAESLSDSSLLPIVSHAARCWKVAHQNEDTNEHISSAIASLTQAQVHDGNAARPN